MTAVEWLFKNMKLYVANENEDAFNKLFEIAKEMEKQQILKAYNKGYDDVDVYKPEKYYSETYKKEKCICKNAELEKDSLVPVYCHNCNVYIQRNL